MTNKEAIINLNRIYGIVSSDIQRSLDLAIKALEMQVSNCKDCEYYFAPIGRCENCKRNSQYFDNFRGKEE